MKIKDWVLFAVLFIVAGVVIWSQVQQARANVIAARSIAESERIDRIRQAPADDFVRYTAITPDVAQVGRELRFKSTQEVMGDYQIRYTDDLSCLVDGEMEKMLSNPDSAAATPTNGIETGRSWPYPFIPTEPTTCELKSVYCFSVEGFPKCSSFTSERFTISP